LSVSDGAMRARCRCVLPTVRRRPAAAYRTGYPVAMPRYEYRCKECGFTFELRRPMAQSDAPAPCPRGHAETVKLLSTVSVAGTSSPAAGSPSPTSAGGGCCGGGCCA